MLEPYIVNTVVYIYRMILTKNCVADCSVYVNYNALLPNAGRSISMCILLAGCCPVRIL
jgi:hypothetical protein